MQLFNIDTETLTDYSQLQYLLAIDMATIANSRWLTEPIPYYELQPFLTLAPIEYLRKHYTITEHIEKNVPPPVINKELYKRPKRVSPYQRSSNLKNRISRIRMQNPEFKKMTQEEIMNHPFYSRFNSLGQLDGPQRNGYKSLNPHKCIAIRKNNPEFAKLSSQAIEEHPMYPLFSKSGRLLPDAK